MQIPTVKHDLYRKNRYLFTQQVVGALESTGICQVDGIDQKKVDSLIRQSKIIIDAYLSLKKSDEFKEEIKLKRRVLSLTPTPEKYFNRFPEFSSLVIPVYEQVHDIYDNVLKALKSNFKELNFTFQEELYLFQYYGNGITYEGEERILLEPHTDDSLSVLPLSSKGLEFFLEDEWQYVKAKSGHALIFPGSFIEEASKGKIKATPHRVRKPLDMKGPRTSLVYGV